MKLNFNDKNSENITTSILKRNSSMENFNSLQSPENMIKIIKQKRGSLYQFQNKENFESTNDSKIRLKSLPSLLPLQSSLLSINDTQTTLKSQQNTSIQQSNSNIIDIMDIPEQEVIRSRFKSTGNLHQMQKKTSINQVKFHKQKTVSILPNILQKKNESSSSDSSISNENQIIINTPKVLLFQRKRVSQLNIKFQDKKTMLDVTQILKDNSKKNESKWLIENASNPLYQDKIQKFLEIARNILKIKSKLYIDMKYRDEYQALQGLTQLMKISIEFNFKLIFLNTYKLISEVHFMFGDYKSCIQTLFQMKLASELFDNDYFKIKAFFGIAECCRRIKMIDKAIMIYKKALQYAWFNNFEEIEIKIYDCLSRLFMLEDEYIKSNYYHNKWLNQQIEPKDSIYRKISNKEVQSHKQYEYCHPIFQNIEEKVFKYLIYNPFYLQHGRAIQKIDQQVAFISNFPEEFSISSLFQSSEFKNNLKEFYEVELLIQNSKDMKDFIPPQSFTSFQFQNINLKINKQIKAERKRNLIPDNFQTQADIDINNRLKFGQELLQMNFQSKVIENLKNTPFDSHHVRNKIAINHMTPNRDMQNFENPCLIQQFQLKKIFNKIIFNLFQEIIKYNKG